MKEPLLRPYKPFISFLRTHLVHPMVLFLSYKPIHLWSPSYKQKNTFLITRWTCLQIDWSTVNQWKHISTNTENHLTMSLLSENVSSIERDIVGSSFPSFQLRWAILIIPIVGSSHPFKPWILCYKIQIPLPDSYNQILEHPLLYHTISMKTAHPTIINYKGQKWIWKHINLL